MSKVIIAEKPSVARNIAEAVGAKIKKNGYFEGKDYFVTWAFGHLLELYDAKEYDDRMKQWRMENFPFIPKKFKYRIKYTSDHKLREDEGAKKQLEIIRQLIEREEVSGVISACDYDREGQIIGDTILDYLYSEKIRHKTQERLLLNEWTPMEVKRGLDNLLPNSEMRNLKDAGISRQWADWVIGINLTTVATLKYKRGWTKTPLNIGRVLLPTLKIIYDRDREIENFKPEEYSRLIGSFCKVEEADGAVSSSAYEGNYTLLSEDKFSDKAMLKALAKKLQGKNAKVIDKKAERKKEYPPALYNLSGLQGSITGKYKGWTAEKVLKVAQNLYEKKLITYPRTASIALEETLKDRVKKVLFAVKKNLPYEEQIRFSETKRVFNNEKVESHSAIIPTYILPKNLTEEERLVYEAVKNRFVMQFMPLAEYEEGVLITGVVEGENSWEFVSKGRIQRVMGWKQVENITPKDRLLPKVEIGDSVSLLGLKVETKKTQPPKKHTEKTLLRIMETCGKKYRQIPSAEDSDPDAAEMDEETVKAVLSGFSIGTPATRAETIKKLRTAGYMGVSGKNLFVTEVGRKLIEIFPAKELLDLEYTGRLEKSLSDIERGKGCKEAFLKEVFDFTIAAVDKIKKDEFHIIHQAKAEADHRKEWEVLGRCPSCKGEVIETDKTYSCTNHRGGCRFVIWKEDRFLASLKVRITKEVVKSLLCKGAVYSSQLVSRKGIRFSAVLTYEKNVDNDYYSWKIHFRNKEENSSE